MWPMIKRFFTDETAFAGIGRALVFGLGTAVATGSVPFAVPAWVGFGLQILSLAIRAGEKNPNCLPPCEGEQK